MTFSKAKRKKLEEAERLQTAALRAYLESLEEEARIDESGLSSVIVWPEFSLEDAS